MTQLEAAKIDEAVTLASQHVGIRGHKADAFLRTLKMCGYELAPLPRDQAHAPALVTTDEPAPRVGEASVSHRRDKVTPTRCSLVGDALHGYAMAERPDGKWVGYDEYLAARLQAIEECAKYLENIGFAACPDRADAAAWKRAAQSLRALQKKTHDIEEKR